MRFGVVAGDDLSLVYDVYAAIVARREATFLIGHFIGHEYDDVNDISVDDGRSTQR